MPDKGEFTAVVVANKRMGEPFGRLRLEFSQAGARAFADFKPGQFAQLDLSNIALPSPEDIPQNLRDAAGRKILLRRPFSFAEIVAETDRTFAELLYCVVGPATVRMTTLRSGDPVSIIGPLGNGYNVGEGLQGGGAVGVGDYAICDGGHRLLLCHLVFLSGLVRHLCVSVVSSLRAPTMRRTYRAPPIG